MKVKTQRQSFKLAFLRRQKTGGDFTKVCAFLFNSDLAPTLVTRQWFKTKNPSLYTKSSLDDWMKILVHFSGLKLLAQSLNSGRVLEVVENSTRFQFKPRWILATAVLLGLWMSGCNSTTTNQNSDTEDKPNVVATSTIIQDLTEKVGGDEIELRGILQPGADPHVYEPVPADSQALETADLILYNGYNLEPGLIKQMNAAGVNAKKFAVGEVVTPLDFDYQGKKEPDPHVWGDAENAIKMVDSIREQLIALSPEDEEEFTQNAARLTEQLQQLDSWITQQIQTIPGNRRQLVTTHDAFQYYARAYGLEVTGTLIGISTEEQPSAQTVKSLSDAIKATKVPAIFAETTINPALIKTVAQEAGVKLAPEQLYSDSIGAVGSEGDTYVKMLVANTHTIVEALGGDFTAFEGAEQPKTSVPVNR